MVMSVDKVGKVKTKKAAIEKTLCCIFPRGHLINSYIKTTLPKNNKNCKAKDSKKISPTQSIWFDFLKPIQKLSE